MAEFRIRVTDTLGNRSYIVRETNGLVHYYSGNETPLALSNLVGNEAAELRFRLRDARTTRLAMAAIHDAREKHSRVPNRDDPTKIEVMERQMVKLVLGHEFNPMTHDDWKTFAGAEEGTLICWPLSSPNVALMCDPSEPAQIVEVRFDDQGRTAQFLWSREEMNTEPGYTEVA